MNLQKEYNMKHPSVWWCDFIREYQNLRKQAWTLNKSIKKKELKISNSKMEFFKFKFKSDVEGNGSDGNIGFRDQLIDKIEKFKYFGSIMQMNRGILKDVGSKVRCGLMTWKDKDKSIVW